MQIQLHYTKKVINLSDNKLVLKSRRLRGEDGSKVLSVRMREGLVSRIDDIANKTGRSRNELFSILIEYALDNCIIKDK